MVCDPCQRMDELRDGLRAELEGKRGMLARVVESGEVAVGDEIVAARESGRVARRLATKTKSSSPA